jgi:hypothetical protein
MKYIFCIDEDKDLYDMETGEINKFCSSSETYYAVVNKENQREEILNSIETFDDDEFVVFVPHNNLLIEPVQDGKLEKLKNECVNAGADYCRLRRISSNKKFRDKQAEIHKDPSDIFYLAPHIIKVSALRKAVDRVKSGEMFWLSLETMGLKGIFYYSHSDFLVDKNTFTFFPCKPLNTLTAITTLDGKWSNTYINSNKKILKAKISEYNIDIEDRGVEALQGAELCCGDDKK